MRPKSAPSNSTLALTSFFSADDIAIHLDDVSRNHAIRHLMVHLANSHGLKDVDACYNAVIERENANDTVVANGIAIPHARLDNLHRPYVGVATSKKGITFAEDKEPVHLILLVLIPRDQPGLYLQILRAMGTILRDRKAAYAIAQLNSTDEVMRFFERGGMVLPEYVCAADIMCDTIVKLRDNENLQAAIDLFIKENLTEIPVVDRNNHLVGVVCASALLKVCLPEYLLWMNDLSAICNFEPFIRVMQSEHETCLTEILLHDYPAVQMCAPAITVAAELARRDTTKCYVLNDKKLAGIIDLPLFLDKIFRE